MVAEYRRLLHAREYSGKRELGWLGADEVAWLEEELQCEEDDQPVEYYDEEQELYEQYQHALQQEQQQQQQPVDEFGDLDDAVFDDVVEDRMDMS